MSHSDAIAHLRDADTILCAVIDAVGPYGLAPASRGDHLTTLARAIVGQQLSGKAAETIWGRLIALFPNPRKLDPARVLETPDAELRGVGLSAAKTAAIKDL